MRLLSAALLMGLVSILPAAAQNESVTVTGTAIYPSRETIIRDFVKSYVTPSALLGKIANWQDPVCPFTLGLSEQKNLYVSDRVKKIAAMVGAPVRVNAACKVNAVIIFASEPQELVDEIRKHGQKYSHLIGDVDGPMHAKLVARFKSPVQAWYGTEIKDSRGNRFPSQGCWPDDCNMYTTGSRLNNGISSLFSRVLIVVNLKKSVGNEVGSMADYIAMLALSQTNAFGVCRELPSISNLLTPGCDASLKSKNISEVDLAFLRGVYKLDPAGGLNLARGDIYNEINKSMDAKASAP